MRRSESSVALIRREEGGEVLWLARWNSKWRAFHFVAGHREPAESPRECLVREMNEELGLTEGSDFTAATVPRAKCEFDDWSDGAKAETRYVMTSFDVELTDASCRSIEADPANRWLSESEIREGRCRDGRPVSRTMRWLLEEIDVGGRPDPERPAP